MVASYAWIIWLVLILVFVIIEMLTVDFIFVMIAVGSAAGLVAELFGAPLWLQIGIAAIVSILLIFLLRPPLLRALKRGGDPTKSNVDALIGMRATVVSTVTEHAGLAKLAVGETWSARTASGARELQPGEQAVVVSIEGATAFVAPSAESAPSTASDASSDGEK